MRRFCTCAKPIYHLGPERIDWYLARDQEITMFFAGVDTLLRHNHMNCLPKGIRMRKVHSKR